MKKTLSLLMAIVMLMSVLVIPAAAAVPMNEIIEPQDAVVLCLKCGTGRVRTYDVGKHTETITVSTCPYTSGTHTHARMFGNYTYRLCDNCGDTNRSYWSGYQYTVCRGIFQFEEQH